MNEAIATVIQVDKILNVCQRRCKDLGVSISYSHTATTASTNGTHITLPYVSQPVTQLQMDRLYGFVIHECGHHLRPEAFNILNAARPPEHLQAIYNILEDDGMERERATEWLGDCKALSIMNAGLIEEFTETLIKKGTGPVTIESKPMTTLLLNQLSRLEWDDYSQVPVSNFIKNMPKDVKELLSVLEEDGWVNKLRATDTPLDTWNLSVDLAKKLYPDNNQGEYEEIRQAGLDGASNEKQEPRDTSKDTMSDSDGKIDGKGKTESTGDVVDKTEDDTDDMRVINWKDCVLSEHAINKDGPPGGFAIDWQGHKATGRAYLMPTSKVNVMDMTMEWEEIEAMVCYAPSHNKWKRYLPKDEQARQFANQVRRYIQAQARSVVEKEKYHGTLDKSAIIRLALPPIDGGEYNKRIFYTQRKHTMKNTCIFILTDWSGSMRDTKMIYAADASQRLVYTFERILKVPVALAVFSDRKTKCDIGYIKRYNTRGLSAEEIAKRFNKFYSFSSGNNDADAVHWAWKEILKRKEVRKIFIVLSDGAPTDSWRGHADTNLKYITNTIEKDGRVELYGVGICSDAVRNYYTNYKVLNSPDQINNTLFNVIKEGDNVKRKRAVY